MLDKLKHDIGDNKGKGCKMGGKCTKRREVIFVLKISPI
jgi:hypothetical protein